MFRKNFLIGAVVCLAIHADIHGATIYISEEMVLHDAILRATSGDTLILAPGWYYGDLVLNKPVVLIGSGIDSTTVANIHGGPVFTVTADAVITGMSIVGVTSDTHLKWGLLGPDILIENASPRIEGNNINFGGYAVLVRGQSTPIFRRNILGGAQPIIFRLEDVPNDVDARWNIWGNGWVGWIDTYEEIGDATWDQTDESGLGRVIFNPWLRITEANRITTLVRGASWGAIKFDYPTTFTPK